MAVASVAGVVLGAWYMLWAVERVFFGASRQPPAHDHADHGHPVPSAAEQGATVGHAAHAGHVSHGDDSHGHGGHGHAAAEPTDDLRWYEWVALAPLALFVLWIGLFPATFLGPSAVAVRTAMAPGAAAFAARMGAPHDATLPQTAQADAATILPGAAIVPSDPPLTAGLERIP
jgi:NADH-quinone oxidoreductase subunit M